MVTPSLDLRRVYEAPFPERAGGGEILSQGKIWGPVTVTELTMV